MFYIKDNKIIGQEWITSKIPNAVVIFSKGRNIESKSIRGFEKMNSRMRRLKADGYYLIHNHTSISAKPSPEDMKLTRSFAKNVKGFLGHIVLGSTNKYSIIEKNSEGLILMPEEKILNKTSLNNMEKALKENTLYDIKISSQRNLIALLKQIQNEKDYSTAILTDCKCNIRMIFDVPNKMFNQDLKNLNGFFKNIARNSGSTRVFIGTQDRETYNRIIEHQKYGTIKDMVFFDVKNDLIITEEVKKRPDLFDKEMLKGRGKYREGR